MDQVADESAFCSVCNDPMFVLQAPLFPFLTRSLIAVMNDTLYPFEDVKPVEMDVVGLLSQRLEI